jgi:hypothetical protein
LTSVVLSRKVSYAVVSFGGFLGMGEDLLGALMTAPALAASESAKMTGQDQTATAPARHRAQSAKMHENYQRQNPTSPSAGGPANTGGAAEK